MTPDEVMAKPYFVRCFIFASMRVEIEANQRRMAQDAARRATEKAAPKIRPQPKRRR
jgi:hypothetical protein